MCAYYKKCKNNFFIRWCVLLRYWQIRRNISIFLKNKIIKVTPLQPPFFLLNLTPKCLILADAPILHGLNNAYFYPSCSLKGQIPDASTEWKDRGGIIGQSWVGRISSQKQAPSQHNPLFWWPSEELSTLLTTTMSDTVRTSSTLSADNVRYTQAIIYI